MRYWESGRRRKSPAKKRTASLKRSIASGGGLGHYPFLRKFYQHQAVISVGLTKFIFFLVIAVLLYAFVVGDGGIVRIMQLRHDKANIEQDLAMLDQSIGSLEYEIQRLDEDPSAMEKLGREHYGFVYPGDRVYKIIRPTR